MNNIHFSAQSPLLQSQVQSKNEEKPQQETSEAKSEVKLKDYSNAAAYAGAGVGAVGSAVGIVKTNKAVSPYKDILKGVEENILPGIKTAEDAGKNSAEAITKIISQIKELSPEEINNFTNAYLNGILKQYPESAAAAESLNQLVQKIRSGEINEEKMIEIIKNNEELADMLPDVENISANAKSIINDVTSPEIKEFAVKQAGSAESAAQSAKNVAENLASNPQKAKELVSQLVPNIEGVEQEIKGQTLANHAEHITSVLKEAAPENMKEEIDTVQASVKEYAKASNDIGEGALKVFGSHIDEIKESVKNNNFKSISEAVETGCQKGLKTLGKYQKLGILASLALIPAGFGIGSFIDRIKNSNKIKNN